MTPDTFVCLAREVEGSCYEFNLSTVSGVFIALAELFEGGINGCLFF
jgi:hypothetical protein